ncbi:MAG: sugar transferase [Acidimicrobiales bacterium]
MSDDDAQRSARWATWYRFATPAIDRTIALVALVALSPLLLLIALLTRLDSDGPALFRQRRVGHRQQTFTMLKFRSMRVDVSDERHRSYVTTLLAAGEDEVVASAGTDGTYKLENDDRITRVGRFLRATGLDELPQLVNIVRGEMALVGPRPALDYEVELYREGDHARFAVLPGITGLWQATARNQVDMRTMLDLDLEYVARRNPLLDLRIIVWTLRALVANPRGAR